jgi:uncharacterized membrane protein
MRTTMNALGTHFRNKMLAGALALAPLLILIYAVVWLEANTQPFSQALGLPPIPGLGLALGVVGVYMTGLAATSLIGGIVARALDFLLQRIPGLNLVYRTWKDVLLLPPGKTGVYHQVVLVPSRGAGTQVGFTSGAILPGTPARWAVFVPSLPNPLSGQLLIYPCAACVPLAVTVEEAFKFLLSTGNFVPSGLQETTSVQG